MSTLNIYPEFRKRREQVKAPLRPLEIEELAQAVALYEGIDIESARWYAIGVFHEACGASNDTPRALAKCKGVAQATRSLAKQAGVA